MLRLFTKKRTGDVLEEPESGAREGSDPAQVDLELTNVGEYEILAPIGTGGTGTVYKAIDRARDQTVAIKVLHRYYDLDKKRRKRDYLGREIKIAASLRHENIIRMHKEIIEQTDVEGNIRRCLIMEYIDGHNLTKHIKDRDLTMQQMTDICVKLCHGLDFLHQHSIIHRDIKPHNFLFSRDLRQVKIADFGFSKSVGTWRSRWMREGGGTPRYMCPEQISKKSLDERSDIFQFGITMYELFAGKHPCTGQDSREIMQQIRSSRYKIETPSKHNPEIPLYLDRIIMKALRRQPERRYQSVTQVLLDLTRMAESRI